MAYNELFQYSVVLALMDGVAERGLPIPELLSHGNHGLGTFKHMRGEMIIIDGNVYQMKADGTITTIDSGPNSDAIAPFAMVTRFDPTIVKHAEVPSKQGLANLLTGLGPGLRNHYVAFRVDGEFSRVTVRTAAGQTFPHEGLAEVGRQQTTCTIDGPVDGFLVGFRSPAYMQGVSVAGDHMHFITKDRKRGGHVLACESHGEVMITAAPITRVVLQLPEDDPDFNQAKMAADNEGIAKVEG